MDTFRSDRVTFLLEHANDPHGPDDPCVLWPWGIKAGYGVVRWEGFMRPAHVVLTQLRDGPAPEGRPLALHDLGHTGESGLRRCIIHTHWGSRADNSADMIADGTRQRGESHGISKLSEADVGTIRVMLADGVRQKTVAEWFEVTRSTISAIACGRTWDWYGIEPAPGWRADLTAPRASGLDEFSDLARPATRDGELMRAAVADGVLAPQAVKRCPGSGRLVGTRENASNEVRCSTCMTVQQAVIHGDVFEVVEHERTVP